MKRFLLVGLLSVWLAACTQGQSDSSKDTSLARQDSPTVTKEDTAENSSIANSPAEGSPAASSPLEDKANGPDASVEPSLEAKTNNAKLSAPEVQKLLAIDQNNYKGIDVKIVVPTYVPTGFKVSDLKIEDHQTFGPSYRVIYQNDNDGTCFEIFAASGGAGAGAEEFELVTVNSKALGTVDVGFTQFHSVTNQPRIGLKNDVEEGIIPSDQGYSFWSPSGLSAECDAIEFQEAAKIVESLDYLNP
ncbi:MAG: hypothetical protein AAF703_08505 [Cyanobacteria bacterium P01_D01_bin.105]